MCILIVHHHQRIRFWAGMQNQHCSKLLDFSRGRHPHPHQRDDCKFVLHQDTPTEHDHCPHHRSYYYYTTLLDGTTATTCRRRRTSHRHRSGRSCRSLDCSGTITRNLGTCQTQCRSLFSDYSTLDTMPSAEQRFPISRLAGMVSSQEEEVAAVVCFVFV